MQSPWSKRIRALQDAGFTLQEIGEVIGLTVGGVGDLAVGRNEAPRGEAALKLHAMHLKHCNGKRRRATR
jgi:DNA-binding transcriptional MerR regulator